LSCALYFPASTSVNDTVVYSLIVVVFH